MAKPSEADFDAVHDFLQGIEEMFENWTIPDTDNEADPESINEWIDGKWGRVRTAWSRVLWAGKTAIDNACIADAKTLEWKPEIAAAMRAAGLEA